MKKLLIALLIASTAFVYADDSNKSDERKGIIEEIVPAIGEGAGKAAAKIKEGTKKGIKAIGAKIEENEMVEATGILKAKGKGKNRVYSIKAENGTTYILQTLSGSEKSYATLDLYLGKKIKVNGSCNKETKILKMLAYSLVMEETENQSSEL